jgi:1-aminocyclopropane-1-carboxylate deaminase/D-cysteine desulfhydrase-like pyridoxal-dependent ACC family enzyme
MLNYSPTPIIEIQSDILRIAKVRLLVKREDLNHPTISGNKWWKLKYNLEEARKRKHDTILTFGGAYSNHIFSTAAAANELGLKSIGVIRGEQALPLNKTLDFANRCGMQLHYVSREIYRKKTDPKFIERLRDRFGDFYLIPEGGTNEFAIKGCCEFAVEHLSPIPFDHLCVAVGTGGTIAGIIAGLHQDKNVIGVSVLKDNGFLTEDVDTMLNSWCPNIHPKWKILSDYHHGGYAKSSPELLEFINRMARDHNLPLDPVYTGKMMFAVMEEIRNRKFPEGSTILAIHTGGLQKAASG